MRMRVTLRGFKDRDADDLVTFAGTTSRPGQRLIVSEAVCRGWIMCTADVRKAFLKGITYEELARLTGEPMREANFELPGRAVAMLNTLPGYETFDPRTEVLHMLKPGTGCKDAPRCWSIRFTKVTNDIFGCRPLHHDDQLVVRHDKNDQLDCMATKHVDDAKIAAEEHTIKAFIKQTH